MKKLMREEKDKELQCAMYDPVSVELEMSSC